MSFEKAENDWLTPPEPKLSSFVCEYCDEHIALNAICYETTDGRIFCLDCLREMSALEFVKEYAQDGGSLIAAKF
ncbi:MAG: hypothetical protein LUG91_00805 [Ruminococcus sp.]|nr:hypothetical protein [Ruminococcus sp.]